MYSSVFVDMSNYVKAQGVLPSSYHESEIVDIPKCFYAHWSGEEGQTKEDMIIMENLIPLGFVFISQGDISSNKLHVDLVVREIAKFHAISYCMSSGEASARLKDKYSVLRHDSIYRPDTYQVHLLIPQTSDLRPEIVSGHQPQPDPSDGRTSGADQSQPGVLSVLFLVRPAGQGIKYLYNTNIDHQIFI